MMDPQSPPASKASQLQEALDTVAQTFDCPSNLSIRYTTTDGTKRTTFEIEAPNDESAYELRYDGHDDESEPELVCLD